MLCQKCQTLLLQCSEPVRLFGQELAELSGKTCGATYCPTCKRIDAGNGTCPLGRSDDCPALSK
jgi:hypothetical protein